MSRTVGAIKAEAYNEVAVWLEQYADRMQAESEAMVFAPHPTKATLDARGVKGLASDLRKLAKKLGAGAGK